MNNFTMFYTLENGEEIDVNVIYKSMTEYKVIVQYGKEMMTDFDKEDLKEHALREVEERILSCVKEY